MSKNLKSQPTNGLLLGSFFLLSFYLRYRVRMFYDTYQHALARNPTLVWLVSYSTSKLR